MGPDMPKVSSPHFAFGSAVGDGVQCLLAGGTLNEAWLKAFLAWDCNLQDAHEKGKKSFPWSLEAIKTFAAYANIILQDWEIFSFVYKDPVSGEERIRKATELSAIIELPNGFKYRVYMDCVLRHKKTGRLVVVELKTTGSKRIQAATYSNSNQALGYSVILDAIAPGFTSYDVWYYIYGTNDEDWEFFEFPKNRIAKANWLRTILHDARTIKHCIDDNYFPRHGENCISFGHVCTYYETCHMSNLSLYGGPHVLENRVKEELAEEFDFRFTIEELLDQQIIDSQGEVV